MNEQTRAVERLYTNEDGTRVLRKGDPGAAKLFKAQWQEISAREIEKYQLDPVTGLPMEALTEPTIVLPSPSAKKATAPENKMAKPEEDKAVLFGGGVREKESEAEQAAKDKRGK